jgi:ATP-binding cassette subfamily C (CFTR/MRP) protein 10
VANTMFSLIRAFLFAYGGICAAKTIHDQLLRSVMRGQVCNFVLLRV